MRSNSSFVYYSVLAVGLPGFSVGTLLGWEYVLTLNSDANISTFPFGYVAAIIGAIISAYLMDRFGRRCAIIFHPIPMYISLFLACFLHGEKPMSALRFIGGLSVGAYYQLVPIYLSEIVYRRRRGIILASMGCCLAIGICFSSNAYVHRLQLIMDLLLAIGFYWLLWYFVPDSPYVFIEANDFASGRQTLARCRRQGNIRGEMREIMLDVNAYPSDARNCCSFMLSATEFHADFSHRLIVSLGLLLCSQAVFVSCHGGINRSYYTTAVMDYVIFISQIVIVLLALLANCFVIDVFGRKILLLISCGGIALFYLLLFIISMMASFANKGLVEEIFRKMMVFYFYLGLDFIPFIYASEVWPFRMRASAMAFVLSIYFLAKCLHPVLLFYAQIYLLPQFVHFIYCLYAIASGFFSWFIPPETKQMSLCAIQIRMDHDVSIFEDKLELE